MEMESSSTWVVDTSLDLNINPYYKKLHHQDHHDVHEHKKKFIIQGDLANLQVNDKESSLKEEEPHLMVKELNRISSENQRLTEMLTSMCEKYNVLQTHFLELKDKKSSFSDKEVVKCLKKRKAGGDEYGHNIIVQTKMNGASESSSSDEETNDKRPKQDVTKNKVSRVLVPTDASNINGLVVKDGYQWRKYGQKVTRDNPSPRAYFKCSFAPTCPVKKKVQRSVENPSVLVATYEGEHNHQQPCRAEFMFSTNHGSANINVVASPGSMPQPPTTSRPSSSSPRTSDNNCLVQLQKAAQNVDNNNNNNNNNNNQGTSAAIFQQFLVQQMATSLTKDPNFTAALAAAISGNILDQI